jgi:hypothetical protein
MIQLRIAASVGIVLLAGCSSGMQQSGSTTPAGNSNLITAEELKDAPYGNLYDLIQARRPLWLQSYASSGGRRAAPEVLIGNREMGGPEALRQIPLTSVAQVRYYERSEAQAQFGPEHQNGVIRVQSRASP